MAIQYNLLSVGYKNSSGLLCRLTPRNAGVTLTYIMEVDIMTIADMKIGTSGKIKKVHGNGALRRRIMDMGLINGTEVSLNKLAPLGDPMELSVKGYKLSMRKEDAKMIELV